MNWPNTGKHEPSVFKSKFSSSFQNFKDIINIKFSVINAQLNDVKNNIKKLVTEEFNGSIMSIKNSIIDALREEN